MTSMVLTSPINSAWFSSLTHLNLSNSNLSGQIPSEISLLSKLSDNSLRGTRLYDIVRDSIFNLPNLETLDLSCNDQLNGYFSKTKWNNSASLKELDLIGVNFFVLNLFCNHLERCIPKRPQFATFGNNAYEGNDGLRGFLVLGGCGSNLILEKNNTTFMPNKEGDSTFLSELCWEVVLIGYGCGLIIGFSMEYVMLSSKKKLAF
ncbi:hypothetical protein BC332_16214 [Capsicum chinense]|nr:hypothetical protein BC332_16214 [Capsicum chinense]